jgi:hypothetical protein
VTPQAAPRVRRWLYPTLAVTALVSINPACNRQFEFDSEPGGAGAGGLPVSLGGSSLGGSPSSGSGGRAGGSAGHAEVSGGGASAGAPVSTAGDAGESSTSCGTVSECTAGTHCADGACAQCAGDDDCAVYGMPRCDPTRHRCVACLSTADCQNGYACDSLANHCLQTCVDDDFCPASAHGCDELRHVCYQCDDARECATAASGQMCASDGSGCVQCRKEADCPAQHCDPLSGRCVDCRDGHDCASQICDFATFTCVH